MLNFTNATLAQLVVHFVGNKTNGGDLVLSEIQTDISKADEADVSNFLVSGFRNAPANHFTHVSDLSLNPVYNYASRVFDVNSQLLSQSKNIAKQLYSLTNHPAIKEGELIVSLVENLYFDDEVLSGLVIIKSEAKNKFFKPKRSKDGIVFAVEEGISTERIDKGCLILNTGRENGFTVFVIDKTNSGEEAQFWTNAFLSIEGNDDSFHNTKSFLSMYKSFITSELPAKVSLPKTEQIELLNKSVSYFKGNDAMDTKSFNREVLKEPAVIKAFNQYKENYADGRLQDTFLISSQAVKQQAKSFKSIIKLDKNFHIYIHGSEDLIERGFDETKGKSYYKIYFDKES